MMKTRQIRIAHYSHKSVLMDLEHVISLNNICQRWDNPMNILLFEMHDRKSTFQIALETERSGSTFHPSILKTQSAVGDHVELQSSRC